MFANIQKFASESTFGLDANLTLASTMLQSAERLAALNLNIARKVLDHAAQQLIAVQGAADVKALVAPQALQAKPLLESLFAYSHAVYEIAAETKEELAKVIEVQLVDAHAKTSELIDKALESAPAGTENSVAALRAVVDSANVAYAKLSKAAKAISDATEANILAIGAATANAADKASKAAKKAA